MVERSLSMREVPGSIPGASTDCFELELSIMQSCDEAFNEQITSVSLKNLFEVLALCKKTTAPGVPRRSPIQVLTWPNVA